MIELLYEYGVDPCSTSNDWRNHIHDDEDIEELDEGHPLSLAATNGHLSVVTLLLEYGVSADLPTEGYEKQTALHHSAGKGHLDIVRELIDAGTPVEVQADQGENPLALAAKGGHLDIVQLLLSVGADPNITTRNRGTSLCMASCSGNIDIVRCLLEELINDKYHELSELPATEFAALVLVQTCYYETIEEFWEASQFPVTYRLIQAAERNPVADKERLTSFLEQKRLDQGRS